MLKVYNIFLARFSNGTYRHFAAASFDSALFDISYYIEQLNEPEVDLISIERDTEVSSVLIFKK